MKAACFLDYLSKAKIFPNFSAGNRFLLFNRSWNIRYCGRCHFITWKKANTAYFFFSVSAHKSTCFDESEIYDFCIAI